MSQDESCGTLGPQDESKCFLEKKKKRGKWKYRLCHVGFAKSLQSFRAWRKSKAMQSATPRIHPTCEPLPGGSKGHSSPEQALGTPPSQTGLAVIQKRLTLSPHAAAQSSALSWLPGPRCRIRTRSDGVPAYPVFAHLLLWINISRPCVLTERYLYEENSWYRHS